MLGHLNIGVAHHALNGLHIHPQGLELGDIGVAAAMGCEGPDAYSGHGSLKVAAEMGGVKGLAGYAAIPEKLPRLISEKQNAGADALWNGNIPDAVGGLRRANAGLALDQIDGLANVDARAVRLNVLGLQRQNLLRPHSCCQHEADGVAHPILGQLGHEDLDFLGGKGLPPFRWAFGAKLVGKANRIFANQVIGLGLMEDLIKHGG